MTSTTESSPASVATDVPAARAPRLRRVLDAVGVQNISLLIALGALVAYIGAQNTNFFLISNIQTIGTTVSIVGVLAVVQTLVMLIGGLDISVGSAAGLTSVVAAMVFTNQHSAGAGSSRHWASASSPGCATGS
jgi:ribose transport system permease protein